MTNREWALIPIDMDPKVEEAMEEAHMPFGDMGAVYMAVTCSPYQLKPGHELVEEIAKVICAVAWGEHASLGWQQQCGHYTTTARAILSYLGVDVKDQYAGNDGPWREHMVDVAKSAGKRDGNKNTT